MSELTTALLSEAEKLAKVADAISDTYAAELGRVLRDLERQLRRLALDALEGSTTALSKAVRAAKLRRQVQQALNASGYPQLAETATTVYLDRLVAQMETLRLAAQLNAFTSADLTRILALKEVAKVDLLGVGNEMAHALWRTLKDGLLSGRPAADLLEDLSDAFELEEHEARTLYDTLVSVFGRQVEAMKSVEGDVYAYIGPVDLKLRPFCRKHVGRVYTKPEIDALDNGQMPNVFATGGGYNCRHVWQAISKLSELRKLVGTDQRIPEVDAALKRIPAGDRKAA